MINKLQPKSNNSHLTKVVKIGGIASLTVMATAITTIPANAQVTIMEPGPNVYKFTNDHGMRATDFHVSVNSPAGVKIGWRWEWRSSFSRSSCYCTKWKFDYF
jgi:hypothetical protein